MIQRLPIIGVMGSGKLEWDEWALPLGQLIATKAVHLLTGGGAGTMTAVGRAFTENPDRKGLQISFIPTENGQVKPNYPNPYVEIPLITPLGTNDNTHPDVISRNDCNVMTSNIIIALPGTGGTINEVNIATRLNKPLILFGPETAFTEFPDGLNQTQDINQVNQFINHHIEPEQR